MPLAFAVALGRLAGTEFGLPLQAALLAAFACLHSLQGAGRARQLPWAVAFALTAGSLLALPDRVRETRLPAEPGLLQFRGRLTQHPRPAEFGEARSELLLGGERIPLRLRGMRRAPLRRGDSVAGIGWYEPAPPPGGRPNISMRSDRVRVTPAPLSSTTLQAACRTAIERPFRDHLDPRAAALVLRLLLGIEESMPSDDVRGHKRTGLAHLLAVSGLHAVLVAQILYFVLRVVCRSPQRRFFALALCLLCYAWLVGFRPPVTRAVFGYVVWRWCRGAGRTFSLAAAMAGAIALTALLFPDDLGTASFCLSYLAVAGLHGLTGLFRVQALRSRGPLLRYVSDCTAASIAAQIATAALSFRYFGYIAPWGIVWNTLALPFIAAMLALALLLPPIAICSPNAAAPGFALLDLLATSYLAGVSAVSTLPASPLLLVGRPPPLLVETVLVCGLLVAWIRASRFWFLATCCAAASLYLLPWGASRSKSFTLLAVGHGQSALVVDRDASIAIDCGDSTGGGRAAARLARALAAARLAALDHVVLTHGDADHAAGLAELLLRIRVGHMWLPESPRSALHIRLARRFGLPFTVVRPGTAHRITRSCLVLAPHQDADLLSSNDGGLLVDLRFAPGPRIVVTGDQEEAGTLAAARRLRELRADRRCDVLVLPHHAAVTPRLPMLLRTLAPRLCIASTSARRSLHPAFVGGELRRFRPLTTGECGDIRIEVAPRGFSVGRFFVGRRR